MEKKVLAMLLAGAMAIGSLAGCGGGNNNTAATPDDAAAAAEEDNDKTAAEDEGESDDIGKISLIIGLRDEFRATLEAGTLKAADMLGINVVSQDAQNDTGKQIQFVEEAKDEGQKAVIVNLVDTAAAEQIVEAAGDMKVVFVNSLPADESVLNEDVVYVGSDEHESGKYQGEWLAEHFKAEGKTDIKYILLNGIPGQTSTTLRTDSVLKALKDNGLNAEEAAAPIAANYDRATAMDLFAPLADTCEYDCIIANNDAMALGAIEALQQAGKDPADTPVVGIDATDDGCQAIEEGSLAMSVFQNGAGQGYGALMAASNLLTGAALNEGTDYETDKTGHILWVPFEPVTVDNAEDYISR